MQFAVHLNDGSQLKGEAEVVIGSEARHVSEADEELAHEKSERVPSAGSSHSNDHSTPPPSYSDLGQRRPSLVNRKLDSNFDHTANRKSYNIKFFDISVPPEYDTVVGFDNWEESQAPPEFRQRSYSNSI